MTGDSVERTLGELLAEVRNIKAAVAKGDDSRAAVHRRLDGLVEDVGGLKTDLVTVKRDLSDARTVTEEVRRWKLMGLGALGVTGIAAGAIASAVTYFWSDLLRLLRG